MPVTGKILNHLLKRFMEAEVVKEARVQIELPDGQLYDFQGIQLVENVVIGDKETHRLIIQCEKPIHSMGKIIRKL